VGGEGSYFMERTSKRWSQREDEYLEEGYCVLWRGVVELAEALGRSVKAVRMRIEVKGLKRVEKVFHVEQFDNSGATIGDSSEEQSVEQL